MEITDQSFNIVDIKPANMEELTEVITASEFHPKECNHFVYSSSKGTIRLCDMRQAALCDTHAKRKCSIQWAENYSRKKKKCNLGEVSLLVEVKNQWVFFWTERRGTFKKHFFYIAFWCYRATTTCYCAVYSLLRVVMDSCTRSPKVFGFGY